MGVDTQLDYVWVGFITITTNNTITITTTITTTITITIIIIIIQDLSLYFFIFSVSVYALWIKLPLNLSCVKHWKARQRMLTSNPPISVIS